MPSPYSASAGPVTASAPGALLKLAAATNYFRVLGADGTAASWDIGELSGNTIPALYNSSLTKSASNFALYQNNSGNTALNGVTSLFLTIGNVNTMQIGATGITSFLNIGTQGLGMAVLYKVAKSALGATTAQSNTYTPPATQGSYLLVVYFKVTTAGTSTIPTIAYKDENGTTVSAAPMYITKRDTGVNVVSAVAVGYYSAWFPINIDNSATNIVVTITPTGSTFNSDLQTWQTE